MCTQTCTYDNIRFVTSFFPSSHPWDLIKGGISQKSAAKLQYHGLVRTLDNPL